MEEFSKTELLKKANDIKTQHDALKQLITVKTYEMEELEKIINETAKQLQELERQYIDTIEKIITTDGIR